LRIWVTGGSGMLGHALVPILRDRQHTACAPSHAECDVTDPTAIAAALDAFDPDAVVHMAAYTAVDRAESEPDQAHAVNAEATETLANEAARRGIHLTYVSTDYVFDGSATAPIPPDTPHAPLGVYGRTKAAGEVAVQAAAANHLIVRTSWLYGAGGGNFVDGMLARLQGAGQALRIVNDQRGRPTWTHTLARALADLIQRQTVGVHHVADGGVATWYDLATAAAEFAGLDAQITPITTEDYPTPAPRPAYSVLDLSATEAALGRALPPWRESLRDYLAETGRLAAT
jgi:dTDP-4-dehydrorhamnose reductase